MLTSSIIMGTGNTLANVEILLRDNGYEIEYKSGYVVIKDPSERREKYVSRRKHKDN